MVSVNPTSPIPAAKRRPACLSTTSFGAWGSETGRAKKESSRDESIANDMRWQKQQHLF